MFLIKCDGETLRPFATIWLFHLIGSVDVRVALVTTAGLRSRDPTFTARGRADRRQTAFEAAIGQLLERGLSLYHAD